MTTTAVQKNQPINNNNNNSKQAISEPESDNEFLGLNKAKKNNNGNNSQNKNSSNASNIKVVIKLRPLLSNQQKELECVFVNEDTVQIRDPPNTTREKVDKAFGKSATQKQLYNYLASSIQKVSEGYNVTILSYGQTGSGKTYTMFGSDWDNILSEPHPGKGVGSKKKQETFYGNIQSDDNFAGVIPRSIHQVFSKIVSGRKNVKVFCSFLQLYNQRMIDLLDSKGSNLLAIHQNKTDGIYVEGLTELEVANFEDCIRIMKEGEKNRIVRQTHMNIKSSRSHTIFQFLIEEVFPDKQSYRVSNNPKIAIMFNTSLRRTKINLCDLAGSQKINKAEEMEMEHFKELKNINLSLTTLGKVIWSLSSNNKSVPSFRDSKLTRLLQDSLGGNTYTTIIGNITSKSSGIDETINTLKFVERARQVKTQVFVKTYHQQPEMQQMQKEILYLKNILKLKRVGGTVQTSSELAERVRELEEQNKRLKQIADKETFQRLIDENNKMKQELQKIGGNTQYRRQNFFNNSQEFSTIDKDNSNSEYTKEEIDAEGRRKVDTSQTIDKISTNTQLPHLGSRYSSSSRPGGDTEIFLRSRQSQNGRQALVSNQNIILRRLEQIQKMKSENKEKLERQLQELERGQRVLNQKGNTRSKQFAL